PTPVRDTQLRPSPGSVSTTGSVVPSAIVQAVAPPSTARVAIISAAVTAAVVLAAVAGVVLWLRAREVIVFTPTATTSKAATSEEATPARATPAARAVSAEAAEGQPVPQDSSAGSARDEGRTGGTPVSGDLSGGTGSRDERRRSAGGAGAREVQAGAASEGGAAGDGAKRAQLAALDQMMEALRASPQDLRLVSELGSAIAERAKLVSDESKRLRIQRIARSSAMAGDVAGLELALDALRAEADR
ncbi:hypothetical protein L6R52_43365, partial [Myxococcota bacterium]|nr:hypothetical protein [Myxococcota bacterium]